MPISRIKTDGIQDDAITSAKIGVDVIVADDLAANSVTVSEITDGAVTGAKLANNLNYDSGTLYLDSTNNRIGIGTSSPVRNVDIASAGTTTASIRSTGTSPAALYIQNSDTGTGDSDGIYLGRSAAVNYLWTYENEPWAFGTGGSERMRIDSTGNLRVGVGNTFEPVMQFTNSGRVEGNPGFTFNGDLDTGMFNPSTQGTIAFSNNGSESMRIDSAGNVGIGTSTPDLGFGGTYLEVANLSNTPSITIRSDRAGGGNLQFGDQDDNNVGYISYQHNNDRMVFRAGDNQQVYIDGAGCMMLGTTTTGSAGNGDLVVNGGVYLGGTGSANKLDDYEEGTWTPVVLYGGSQTGQSYSIQQGRYTKIGRNVSYYGYVQVATNSSATGTLAVGGLPFTSQSGTGNLAVQTAAIDNASGNFDQPVGRVSPNSSEVVIMSGTDTNNWGVLTDTARGSSGFRVFVAGNYITDS